jgi:hypothetical protein
MATKEQKDLRKFLLAHEYDIAWGIEDYDLLENVFLDIIGREASQEADEPSL